MAEEGFLKRWARRKTESRHGQEPAPEPALDLDPLADAQAPAGVAALAPAHEAAPPAAREAEPPPPTMADVALLTPQSDFSAFVRPDVAAEVRRTALKKLFSDPHFNTMDRLDMYMDDYNKPSPMSEEMFASLKHAKSVFRHLAEDKDEGVVDAAAAPAAAAEASAAQDALDAPVLATASESAAEADVEEQAAPAAPPYQQHLPETETR